MGLTCEVCGSSSIIKKDGVFQCQSCGMQYSLEEVRSLLGNAGGSSVALRNPEPGTAPQSAQFRKYIEFARTAKSREDWAESERYYKMAEMDDPGNIEASFYGSYGKAKVSLIENNLYQRQAIFKILQNAVASIPAKYDAGKAAELNPIIAQISDDILAMAKSDYVYSYTKNGYGIVVSSEKMQTVTLFNNLSDAFCKTCEQLAARFPEDRIEERSFAYQLALRHAEYVLANGSLANPSYFKNKRDQYFQRLLGMFFYTHRDNGVVALNDPNHVSFGRFNNIPIDWHVIGLNGNSMLMVSNTCLLKGPISNGAVRGFPDSDLCRWLNSDFIGYAFSPLEQPLIGAPAGEGYPVSLPSVEQVRQCGVPLIAPMHGTNAPSWWWTGTPVSGLFVKASNVISYAPNGECNTKGHAMNDARIGVRPTIWLTF